MKLITVQYYASLREKRGLSEETLETEAATCKDLLKQLEKEHDWDVPASALKVAVNDEFCGWETELQCGDLVVFIPPVAGG